MEQQARCKKCGRILRSPQSIAMGMGWTCAGGQPSSGKTFRIRRKTGTGKAYPSSNPGTKGSSVVGDLSSKPISRREAARRVREERRRLFEQRQPFQCGVLTRTHTPVIYVPLGDGGWKENHSGHVIAHDTLLTYLQRYRLI
jgi:hypothetical protein